VSPAPSRSPEPNDLVRTPSGSRARVLEVYADLAEALVEWETGERARFRLSLLTTIERERS
jgi:hypothetical protein